MLHWTKVLWLAKNNHVTLNNQSQCFILALPIYIALKFVDSISSGHHSIYFRPFYTKIQSTDVMLWIRPRNRLMIDEDWATATAQYFLVQKSLTHNLKFDERYFEIKTAVLDSAILRFRSNLIFLNFWSSQLWGTIEWEIFVTRRFQVRFGDLKELVRLHKRLHFKFHSIIKVISSLDS